MAEITAEAFPKYIHIKIDTDLLNKSVYRQDVISQEIYIYDSQTRTWTINKPHSYPTAKSPVNTESDIFDTNAVANKAFQYFVYLRETPILKKVSNTVIAAPLAKPLDGYGHIFGNYQQPTDQFGEVLTYDDIVLHFLKGLPQTTSSGEVFTQTQVEGAIRMATNWIATTLHIDIFPKY